MVPEGSGLVRDREIVTGRCVFLMIYRNFSPRNSQEGLVRNDRALSDPGDAIHLVSATLEEAVPVLKQRYSQHLFKSDNHRNNHNGCSTTHASVGQTVGDIDLTKLYQYSTSLWDEGGWTNLEVIPNVR